MITEFKMFEVGDDIEVGDIIQIAQIGGGKISNIVLNSNHNTRITKSTNYFKVLNPWEFTIDFFYVTQIKNAISVEQMYLEYPRQVEDCFKRMYSIYEDFDMTTSNQTKNVIDVWLKKVPDLGIIVNIDKYNL